MNAESAKPDISFIVVNWNAGKYLPRFLESLEREAGRYSYEIILVDNGSTDGSLEYVRENHRDVTVLETGSNLGFAGANNVGIRKSAGRTLCLVNPDVILLPESINILMTELESRPRAGIVGPEVSGRSGAVQRSVRPFPTVLSTAAKAFALESVFFDPYRHGREPVNVEVMNGCFWLVRREAFETVGLLDERFFMYSEDMDWCRRFRNSGWDVVYVPGARIIHFGGGSSEAAPVRFYLEMRRANLQYWKKHHSAGEVRLFIVLSILHQTIRYCAYTLLSLVPGKRFAGASFKRTRSLRAIEWFLTERGNSDVPVRPVFYTPAGTVENNAL